jgi:phage terminase small subunit
MPQLTLKQRRFVRAYLETGNATESARRAGYAGSDETLAVVGSENLRKPGIAAALEAADLADEGRAIATRRELRELWTRVAFGDETETVVTREGDTIAVPMPAAARLKASELLGKSRGMFVERREHTGPGGGPIAVSGLPANAEEAAGRIAALAATLAGGRP